MHSAVLILPISLKAAGDQLGELLGWGSPSYTIPLASEDASEATHIALRADASPSFLDMIAAARQGVFPPGVPAEDAQAIVDALIADFSPDPADPEKPVLWGSDHLNAVCVAHGFTRLA